MNKPMISVVMPTYNSEKYVAEAVDSILSQTYGDFEFLVVNDLCIDRSIDIIQSFKDPRIRIIHNTQRLGVASSLNRAMRQSRGKYIARMDSDDISLPERFARQVSFMEDNPDIAICGTWAQLFGDEDGIYRTPTNPDFLRASNLFYADLVHPSVLFRAKDIFNNNLWYNPEFACEDFELFSRASEYVRAVNMPEVLIKYRVTKDSTTTVNADKIILQSRQIIVRNLKRLNVEVTPEQEPFLNSLKSFLKCADDITHIKTLFEKITTANSVLSLYNQPALAHLLNRHYYSLFNPYFKANFSTEIKALITHNAFEMSNYRDVCIFGTGKAFMDLAPYFLERLAHRIICVCDNNPDKWGKEFHELKCIPPDYLLSKKDAIGIIVLTNYDNMMDIITGLKNKGFDMVKPYIDSYREISL